VCDKGTGGIFQMPLRNGIVNQADFEGGFGSQGLSGQHQIHGRQRSDQAGQSDGAAKTWMNAKLDLGQSQAGGRIVAGNTVAAGQSQLQTSTQAEAVNQGNGRARQCFNPVKNFLATPDHCERRGLVANGGKLAHIGTGNKAARFTGTNHQCPGSCRCHFNQEKIQFFQNIVGEAVGITLRPVNGQPADIFSVVFAAPMAVSGTLRCHVVPPAPASISMAPP